MDEKTRLVMTSSANENWPTPPQILDPIYAHLGPILLDPCSNKDSIVKAQVKWSGPNIDTDGLAQSWQTGGIVYVNPPYGRKIKPWISKCAEEGRIAHEQKTGTEVILLGPARTDTKWFQRVVLPSADSVILWEGRLKFKGAKDPAPFPSFIAYWGHRPVQFKIAYVGMGWSIT